MVGLLRIPFVWAAYRAPREFVSEGQESSGSNRKCRSHSLVGRVPLIQGISRMARSVLLRLYGFWRLGHRNIL